MTRIEKALREVSDLRDFYRRITKIAPASEPHGTGHNKSVQLTLSPAAPVGRSGAQRS